MRNIAFERDAFSQFNSWSKEDKKTYARIVKLIDDILREPFSGIGKPEPLKHNLEGCWSRRITDEHRLVYRVTDADVVILSCKYHYD
jgi:toxin YoeB